MFCPKHCQEQLPYKNKDSKGVCRFCADIWGAHCENGATPFPKHHAEVHLHPWTVGAEFWRRDIPRIAPEAERCMERKWRFAHACAGWRRSSCSTWNNGEWKQGNLVQTICSNGQLKYTFLLWFIGYPIRFVFLLMWMLPFLSHRDRQHGKHTQTLPVNGMSFVISQKSPT